MSTHDPLPVPRKSAWTVFTSWLSTSFSSDEYSDEDESSSGGRGHTPRSGNGKKGKQRGKAYTSITPRGMNGFSPSSGGNTSPSPVRSTTNGTPGSSARPAFVRASTLRTIEEGDSPYGSYLSSSVPSLRHLAALSAVQPTSPALIATGHGGGAGLVARRSVSGSSSRRGSVELGMGMIEEREVHGEGEKQGKRSRGKGKERDVNGEEGAVVDLPAVRSRSRSRSPMTPSHTTSSKGRRKHAPGTLEGGDSDDPDDPFYVSPSRRPRAEDPDDDEEEKDETSPLIPSGTNTSSNPITRTTSARESDEEDPEAVGEATKWYRGPLFEAGWKLSLLFALFTIIMVGGVYLGLPPLDA